MNKTFEHNGRIFFQQAGQPYYRSWNTDKARPDYLHRVIWEEAHGPVPEGFDVHHIDENPENNDLSNLEALSRKDHRLLHWESLSAEDKARIRSNLLENAVPAATNWHKSEEGRKWHSEKATKEIGQRAYTLACDFCHKIFERVGAIQKGRFCSPACKAAERRRSGVDDEERVCQACGKNFLVNRYRKSVACSRSCKNVLMWRARKA